ncbi:class I SAM-dependent methyltransferase [Gloeobacter kilaueensis]|uniref:Ubiquinone/menaquinone biosynthesis methyltransferase n=1 Tax=Gloeobacter kilaueensis (strain ATCC BAA-2537 / CCAP 1431/1 / ULC 316 / JS1) TaxID=1183438 RepID=U5QMU0_GLOK1|nr:methyltransferase domain-containing protein [Gloeobacter kilaueensis]AGY58904.1 ubiquinone/menaquinone biosynthesis methyltransferase [Gloeobacter kilaueensis JS1]
MVSFPKARRDDETDDSLFYRDPRLVQHIDMGFILQLQAIFRRYLPQNAVLLDLMSSWVSHLPEDLKTAKVVGHGMNAVELAANPRLDEFFVQNLNADPVLPLVDDSFDGVLNTVSVQYLVDAVRVFQEVRRVLKPGGVAIVSFSNRMFPTKAVDRWKERSDEERLDLVQQYLLGAGGFEQIETHVHAARGLSAWFLPQSDPFFCVTARKAG